MKKNTIIIIAIIIAVVVALCVLSHYVPVWVSVLTVVVFLVGGIAGWFVKVLYDKRIKK